MSINDFEYVGELPEVVTGPKGSTFSTFEEGDLELWEFSIAKAILRKQEAVKAIDALADATGESWFELGEKLAEKRFLGILDNLEHKLVDSEEDAKMVIHIIREMVKNASEEEQD